MNYSTFFPLKALSPQEMEKYVILDLLDACNNIVNDNLMNSYPSLHFVYYLLSHGFVLVFAGKDDMNCLIFIEAQLE